LTKLLPKVWWLPFLEHSVEYVRIRSYCKTRKLSYGKDDRAMPPMYGCPEKFQESLTTPMATFLKIFNGLLFRLSL